MPLSITRIVPGFSTQRLGALRLVADTKTAALTARQLLGEVDRRENEYFREHQEKEELYKAALEAWHAEAKSADWSSPADVKARYGTASILKGGRVVFNICGNKYRLIAAIHYDRGKVYVRHMLTHKEYDLGKWKDD